MRYNVYHLRNLHTPMMIARRGSLRGLMGLGALTLKTDKQSYVVGEAPIYQVLGASPNATLAWTSFKDGVATPEYQASYGQVLDANGRGVFTTSPWTSDDVGLWQKQVILANPDGTTSLAQVFFTVSAPAPAGSTGTLPPQAPGFFDKTTEIFGQQVPTWALLAGLGVAAVAFARK